MQVFRAESLKTWRFGEAEGRKGEDGDKKAEAGRGGQRGKKKIRKKQRQLEQFALLHLYLSHSKQSICLALLIGTPVSKFLISP